MKNPNRPLVSPSSRQTLMKITTFTAAIALSALTASAQDILWSGGTASFNTPSGWSSLTVPTNTSNAVNNSGSNNVVQINVGNPNWTVNQIKAGNSAGDGAFTQNGQTVTVIGSNTTSTAYITSIRLGIAAGSTGIYTLNGGTLNYSNGLFTVGELGIGALNINGGTLTGSGVFAANYGALATPSSTTATMDGGLSNAGFTWFAQGFYAANSAYGLPTAGSTFTSVNFPDHSYTMAASYTTNNAVMVDSNYVKSATVTLTTPTAYSALSFLGSAGNQAMTINYKVHHADSTIETGTLVFPDWFATNTPAYSTYGRVSADGLTTQIQTSGAPFLFPLDKTLTNTASAVTSIDLTYNTGSGGVACLMALSGSNGSGFSPIPITGYNEDCVVDVNPGYSQATDVVTQTNGAVNLTGAGQLYIGNFGTGIYNLSGGTVDVHNAIAIGRAGGNGTLNLTGGNFNQDGGGNLLVGTGANAPTGSSTIGVLNQNGGTINCTAQFLCPETLPSLGTYNMSSNAVLKAHDWIAIGRNGGAGVLNISGNAVIVRDNTNDTGANFDIGAGGPGTVNQNGGAITNLAGQTWISESASATWNLNSGIANLGVVHIGQTSQGGGTLNLNGGTLIVQELTTGSTTAGSTVYFNGGTIVAVTNNATFMHDLSYVENDAAGITFNSQAFNISMAQEIDDNGTGGTLTKLGSGTMTLVGANTYTGNTIVSNGTLIVGTKAGTQSINYTVADTGGFGVVAQSVGGVVNASSLTLGGATGGTLSFNLSSFGNPSSALLNVSGTLTANGTFTVNFPAPTIAVGTIPLLQYGSLVGSPNYVLGTLPTGVVAHLQTTGNVLQLVVTSAAFPRWDGSATGAWDLGPNQDWYDLGTLALAAYTDGHAVVFDDNASGTTTVNLTATVTPTSVLFTNNTKAYAIIGTGKITGTTGVNKVGSGSVALLNTGNDYTGPTVVTAGTLIVTNISDGGLPSSIGAASANSTNLVFGNATLSYVGPTATANRGYKMTGNGTLDIESNLTLSGQAQATSGTLTKVGPATMTYAGANNNVLTPANVGGAYQVNNGTVVFDGSAGVQSNSVIGEMWVSAITNYAANVVLTNTTLGISSWFALGRGNGSNNFQPTASLYNSRLVCGNVSLGYANGLTFNVVRPTLNLFGNSQIINSGAFNLSENSGSASTVTLADNSAITNSGTFTFGLNGTALGIVTLTNNASLTTSNTVWVGSGGGKGVLNMNSTGVVSLCQGSAGTTLFVGGNGGINDVGQGAININSGTLNYAGSANSLYIQVGTGGTNTYGSFNLAGGTVNESAGNGFRVGFSGVGSYVQTGGTLNCQRYFVLGGNGAATTFGNGVATFTGGTATITPTYSIHIPDAASCTGTLNLGTLAGGNASLITLSTANGAGVVMQNGASGNGTLNLNSGTLQLANPIYRANSSGGSAVVNLNGATLQAGANNITLINNTITNINVYKNGITVDSIANTATISGNLLTTTGNGIYPAGGIITVTNAGGAGYIGAPLVTVNGGSGTGATAVATVSGGIVTNVVLTSPGQNYVAGDVLSLVFKGGGATTAASTFIYTLQAGDLTANAVGGLTKIGSGTLYLTGVNTYKGTTLVSTGTLGGSGTITGPVIVTNGATLLADIGTVGTTFTINNSLTLAAGSTTAIKVTPSSNDKIVGLTTVSYNGALIVTNTSATALTNGATFQLFNASTAGTGNFSSVTVLPTNSLVATFNPTNGTLTLASTVITPIRINPVTVVGGNLILTGTGGTPNSSYTVLTTTNVTTPLAAWTTNTAGNLSGTGTLSNAIPIDPTTPTQFFRVRQP